MEVTEQRIDYDKGLRSWVENCFRKRMPALIEFTLKNHSVAMLIRHLRRHTTGSMATAYQYTYGIWRYHLWMTTQPDKILNACFGPEGEPLPKMLLRHAQLVDDFVGYLQEQNLAPGTVANHAKAVRALYRANGLMLPTQRYPRTVVYPGRSPTPEQIQRILAVADSHEKLIVLLFATTGIREATLCRLTYGNLREDFESEVIPCLVRVQPSILKGQAWGTRGHWTFLSRETFDALRIYLGERRRGNRWFEPEEINDNSPLVRNRGCANEVRPISPGAVWQTIHGVYVRAGIISPCPNARTHKRRSPNCPKCGYPQLSQRRHSLSVHSLRWFFRTQLTSQGVNLEYVQFMMGHVTPLYNDVRSKGEQFLREQYAKADLGITPKPKLTDREFVEALLRGKGLDPARIIRDGAFAEPHRLVVTAQDRERYELKQLTSAFGDTMFREFIDRVPESQAHARASPGLP